MIQTGTEEIESQEVEEQTREYPGDKQALKTKQQLNLNDGRFETICSRVFGFT
jgi:hypothetical protein